MNAEKLKRMFSRYLAGKLKPEDADLVDRWYEQLTFDYKPLSEDQKQAIASRISQKLNKLENPPKGVFGLKTMIRAAAVVLVCSAIAFILYYAGLPGKSQSLVTIENTSPKDSTVRLADGSVIVLKPGALISYSKSFAIEHRRIKLMRGNGFFDISPRKNTPFIVQCLSGIEVKVLGTSFDIEQPQSSGNFIIKVATGKVRVSKGPRLLATLTRGQGIHFNSDENRIFPVTAACKRVVAINFEGSNLANTAQRLSSIYNVSIVLSPEVNAKLRTTARFNSGQPVKEILDLLCSLHHLRIRESKDKSAYHIYNATSPEQ